ncbi:cell wall metabolism sensor histidine kinase WalK [Alkalibaculum bacchi]|uniref:sensor histidine kinase n=1 Tax=Alkalibaculum bacchi TaxID=645887 RepID=UPI0026EAFB53|nr:HAMP domain-containing sensor histidine kinase [Alkalibaculum bacchi]
MNLKQRFLTQSILIFIGTILITSCVGFAYLYFCNLFNKSPITSGIGEASILVIENDDMIYKNEDFSSAQVKEILMNVSIGNNYYIHQNTKYRISTEDFTTVSGDNHNIIILNPIINVWGYYRNLMALVFTTFLIVFAVASIIVQKQNMKNIINPITNLTEETEKLRHGDLETAITDKGYGEIRDLERVVEQLRLQLKNSIYYEEKVDDNRKFLISSISHDLKTPVTSIRGYIDGVLDGVADTDEKKQYYLSKAVDKTKIINTMIEDLLLYSKLDLNQMPFEKEKINVRKYVESCIEDSLSEFKGEDKRIVFENELRDEVFITIDVDKFNRVVQNIMDNAKRNIEKHLGQLKIVLRETNSSVIMEFKDNGKGINKEDLPHVFERFYRADAAREVKGSSGLGLAIAKQIVEELGGQIWAISELDKGTSIMISLKKVKKYEKDINY